MFSQISRNFCRFEHKVNEMASGARPRRGRDEENEMLASGGRHSWLSRGPKFTGKELFSDIYRFYRTTSAIGGKDVSPLQ